MPFQREFILIQVITVNINSYNLLLMFRHQIVQSSPSENVINLLLNGGIRTKLVVSVSAAKAGGESLFG